MQDVIGTGRNGDEVGRAPVEGTGQELRFVGALGLVSSSLTGRRKWRVEYVLCRSGCHRIGRPNEVRWPLPRSAVRESAPVKEKKPTPPTRDSGRSNESKQRDDGRRRDPESRRDTERLIDKLVERHKDTLDYLAK